jgi:hypothetical protein
MTMTMTMNMNIILRNVMPLKVFFEKKNPKHENKKDCIFDDLFDIK